MQTYGDIYVVHVFLKSNIGTGDRFCWNHTVIAAQILGFSQN